MRALLGNKGANLCEMARIGLPVPPGFIVTTEACDAWWDAGKDFGTHMRQQIAEGMAWLEEGVDDTEGALPLLVSIRSGAPVSMPGMMDTVLDLGLRNEAHVEQLATGPSERLVRDAWRRFLQMFGSVVLGVEDHEFDAVLTATRDEENVETDAELSASALARAASKFRAIITASCGPDAIPEDPFEQLLLAVGAVFDSWNGEPARVYRAHNGIPDDLGTAVNVQRMVYGNAGDTSGSGVLFTRNPATGENRIYGEYLQNAQGEDVVSGMRTPQPLSEQDVTENQQSLEQLMPDAWNGLQSVVETLEQHFRDVQDVEFTIDRGTLWVLQTRSGKRTAHAALRTAVEMVDEGLITREEALLRVDPESLQQLLVPQFDASASREVITTGIPASPGAASGLVAVTAADAVAAAERGERVVLVRGETSATDIAGMMASVGVITARGGATSHAAVVARGMGKPCVSGCSEIEVDEVAREIHIGSRIVRSGDMISLDGATGEVFAGELATVPASIDPLFARFLGWADEVRTMRVRANADVADDARRAHLYGAEGIGLCRTEHMFFASDRLPHFVRMIVSQTEAERRSAMAVLAPMIEADLAAMFEQMQGMPVTVRLLDPPLHEFLPRGAEETARVAAAAGVGVEQIEHASHLLHEENPMLGHRGVRLAITHPDVYQLIVGWIVRAAASVHSRGITVQPQIMIPLVGGARELRAARDMVRSAIDEAVAESGVSLPHIPVGTMMEVPRACLLADRLAGDAEFLSFGTNDLTQLTYGFSRDDSGSFLPEYLKSGLLDADPFATIDVDGVGGLIEIAIDRAKSVTPDMEIGVCGEHGGDPQSIAYFQSAGFDYVSCSAARVPVARLAAAQAALRVTIGERDLLAD